MKKTLLKYLICPECKTEFDVIAQNDEILTELLLCKNKHCFPVLHGLPVLINSWPLEDFLNPVESASYTLALKKFGISRYKTSPAARDIKLKEHSRNWSYEWKEALTFDKSIWIDKKRFLEHIPVETAKLQSYSRILEVACGRGANLNHVITSNNLVFAIDISESAYFVSEAQKDNKNVFVIRCDALHLPFKDEFFDLVFSDHFLHHADPLEEYLEEIKRVSADKADCIFNLYSKENNQIMTCFIEPFKKVFLNKIPLNILFMISNIPALLLWIVVKSIYFPLFNYCKSLYSYLPLSEHMKLWLSFDYVMFRTTCFDLLHAPFARYYSEEDLKNLAARTFIKLVEKKLLRQTLWILKGSIVK